MARRKSPITGVGLPYAPDAQAAKQRLRSLGCPQQAAILARFFKTGPGEYGEGDRFSGVKVPVIRQVAKEFKALPLAEVQCLLHSEIHEERLLALVILVGKFTKGDDTTRKRIYDIYLANTHHINNWDLVDLSAPQIVGGYLEERSRKPLYRLAKSAGRTGSDWVIGRFGRFESGWRATWNGLVSRIRAVVGTSSRGRR